MPLGPYEDFDACVAANQQADDPAAYCGAIKNAVEKGEDTPWLMEKDWHNDRILETFINDTMEDYEMEKVPLEGQILAMPFFMKHGFLEWFHGADTGGTPMKIGEPIAWRIRDGKPEARFGVFTSEDVGGHPALDEMWAKIQEYGTKGTVSITFAPIEREFEQDGLDTVLSINREWLQSAGWVGPYGASPGAVVTYVSQAKSLIVPVVKAKIGPTSREALGERLKTALKDGLSTSMATEEEAKKAAQAKAAKEKEAAAAQAAKVKELEAKLVAAKQDEEPPEEGGAPPDCPEGFHYDEEAMDCVPDEPMGMEEAIRDLSKAVKENRHEADKKFAGLRDIVMRLVQGMTPTPQKAREDVLAAIKIPLAEVPDSIREAVEAAITDALPKPQQSVEEQLSVLSTDILKDVEDRIAAAQESVLGEFKGEMDEVREKMRQPASKPRSVAVGSAKDGKGKSVRDQIDEAAVDLIAQRRTR